MTRIHNQRQRPTISTRLALARCITGLFAACAFMNQALAENEEGADQFDIDLFAPSGPAFVALGSSPRKAADPGAAQDFKIDVGNVSDGEKSRFGAAISVIPYWWGDKSITLTDYRTNTSKFTRILARTQASLGLARAGGEDTEAIRAGFAGQTQLLDAQDHRFDQESYTCIHNAWQTHRGTQHQDATQSIIEAIESGQAISDEDLINIQDQELNTDDGSQEAYLSARKACRDQATQRLLASPSWLVGFGVGARSEEDELASFDYDGLSLWSSYRQPLDTQGRFAAFTFVRGDMDRVFDFDNDLRAKGDSIGVGLGGAFQSPKFRLDLSVAHTHRSFSDTAFDDDDFQRYTGVADIRLREGFWLELSGGTIVNSDLVDGAFGSVSVKVAWGDYLPFGGN